ncbi:MAG: thiol reductant ABC exporter subunit CydC [Acidimicrobiia bacterium]
MSALVWVLRLARAGRRQLILAALLGALASATAVGLAATSAWLISRASQHPPVLHLMVGIVAVRAFGLARGLLRYGERLIGHDASFRVLGDLRVATVTRLEQILPARSDDPRRSLATGELLARFVGDVESLQDLWVRLLLPYVGAFITALATVTLIGVLVPAAAVILAVTLASIAIAVPLVSIRLARDAGARLGPLRGEYQTGVLDLMSGATELAVYGVAPDRLERLEAMSVTMTQAEARSARAAGSGAALTAAASGVALWSAVWFGARAVQAGSLATVGLAVVALVPLAIHEIFAALPTAAQQLPALEVAASRVREMFDTEAAASEPDHPSSAPSGPYGLRARGLSARWSLSSPEVLRDIDLDIAAGSTTLVVGRSGSGKSTLAAVMLRLLDPSAGVIELVGLDRSIALSAMAGDDVRAITGWCAQDAYIFDSTIEANIRLALPDATDKEIVRSVRRAGLMDWVESLPEGLSTMVGEHGGLISGGQRQRIALARVLLTDRQILVFDEPTEHLDEDAAIALARDIVSETSGRTVIIVTHRPELFPTVDSVIRLDGGRISAGCAGGSSLADDRHHERAD